MSQDVCECTGGGNLGRGVLFSEMKLRARKTADGERWSAIRARVTRGGV